MIASQSLDRFTLRQAYDRYIKSSHKPKTVETYSTLLNHWEAAPLTVVLPDRSALHLRIDQQDPDLAMVDNVTLYDFKAYLSDHERLKSQNSVRKYMKHLAVIFKRLGPADYHNKEGLGILPAIPYAKPPKEIITPNVTIEPHEITTLYHAAATATWPDCEVPAPLWWQSLIVTLYNLGLRRLDYLSARQREFDLRRCCVTFDAEKTGKYSTLPLHPVVVEHLEKVWEPHRELVWPWRWNQDEPDPIDRKKTSLYAQWHRLRRSAGITRVITPHDLRRTCGSDLFAVSPAAASECLQHSSIVTTQRSYANCSPQTKALMLNRTQPMVFSESPQPPDDPMILRFPKSG